jgi:hypothetical protein
MKAIFELGAIVTGISVVTVAILAAATVFGGWVLTLLWSWFVVPIFEMRELTLLEGVGLSLGIGYLKGVPLANDTDDKAKRFSKAASPFVLFGMAYIVHLMMG